MENKFDNEFTWEEKQDRILCLTDLLSLTYKKKVLKKTKVGFFRYKLEEEYIDTPLFSEVEAQKIKEEILDIYEAIPKI